MEQEFVTSIRRLDEGVNDAVVPKITNAGGPSVGEWTALAGIDFPSEGCWEITGSVRGKSLTFVVRTEIPDMVADHRLPEDEAAEVAKDLAYGLVKRAYKL